MASHEVNTGQRAAPAISRSSALAAIEDFAIYAREKRLGETEELLASILAELRSRNR